MTASGPQCVRNRYYDSATGLSTQPDPIGLAGGLNLYGYADGDPVNKSDPFGLCADPPDSVNVEVTVQCNDGSGESKKVVSAERASREEVDAVLATAQMLTGGNSMYTPELIANAYLGFVTMGGGVYRIPMTVEGHPVIEGGVTQGRAGSVIVGFRTDVIGALVGGNPRQRIGNLGATAASVVGHEGVHLAGELDENVANAIWWGIRP